MLMVVILTVPVSAFEDTFQYHPLGTFTSNDNWYAYVDNAKHTNTIVADGDATYSRAVKIRSDAYYPTQGTGYIINWYAFSTNYIAFNLKECYGEKASISYNHAWARVQLLDSNYVVLMTDVILSEPSSVGEYGTAGWYEYTRSGSEISLRIDGVDQGVKAYGASSPIAYIVFETYAYDNYVDYDPFIYMVIDDVTTGNGIVGVCTESVSHTVTESTLNDTNISFSINTFPYASYQASEYKIDIKRSVSGVYIDVTSEVVKSAGNTTPYDGFSNYNRPVDLTEFDTKYGLYMVYLTDDGTSVDTDYFFLAPTGDASTISFSDSVIPIGTIQVISYIIDAADFGLYNYHVRVYSSSGEVFSEQITTDSGSESWDTTDESTGLHYAVLSRTDKSSGSYSEVAYDIATLSEDVIIRGYTYDAQNESLLSNVSINFSQASTWYNTTSNATGYYELTGIITDVEINVNASLINYTHENFTFTPLEAQIYTMNLYLINNTTAYSYGNNTTIGGLVYDYPLHQAVPNATVSIYNATWSNTDTSSITGFYLFEYLGNGSYTINGTKTGYQDSEEYAVDTNNWSWASQNILMYGIYDLTIRAQDATTLGFLNEFEVFYNDTIYLTTNGSYTFHDLTYGLYTFSVSADGYYAVSKDILVDSTKIVTVELTQTVSDQYSPHYVKFTVMARNGTVYPNTVVTVYEGSSSSVHLSGTTGTDGVVGFHLSENVYYRMTFEHNSPDFSRTIYLYPIDSRYNIIVFTPSEFVYNNFTYELVITNETITFNWADPDSEANWVNMTMTNSTGQIQTNNSSGVVGSFTFNILNQSDTYCVNITINTINFGMLYLERCTTPGKQPIDLLDISTGFKNALSMFVIIVISLLFGRASIGIGAIMVASAFTLFWYIDWLAVSPLLIPIVFTLAIGVAIASSRRV